MQTKQATKQTRKAGRAKRRAILRRVPLVAVVAALFVIVAVGSMLNRRVDTANKTLEAQLANARFELDMQNKRRQDLSNQIKSAATDDFIASEARTRYGFLADGAIRFAVSNPVVLWGPEGPPPELLEQYEP